jgi:hypothetical protein
MDEELTYWMEYESKWSYRIIEMPGREVEAFTRQHPTAIKLTGDSEQLAKDKLNERTNRI